MSHARERVAALIARCEAAGGGRAVPGALALVLTVLYSWAYWTHAALPSGTFPEETGWWKRHDPRRYRDQAQAMAEWALDAETHHYPPGYAASAAPFALFDPQHAFFVPNLLYVVGAGMLLYALARRFFGQVESALVVLVAGFATSELLEVALIIPRSTIGTMAIGYAMLVLLVVRPPKLALVYQLVVLDGIAYLYRPGDAVFLAPLLVVAVLQLPDFKQRAIGAFTGVPLLGLFLSVNGAINRQFVRTTVSFYEEKHRSGFTFGRFFETIYFTYLDGAPVYREPHQSLLWLMPWLLLALPGAFIAVKRDSWRQGAAFATVVGSLAFYIAYWNMDPVGLWEFHLVRYISWAFPVLFLFAWLAVRGARELSPRLWVVTGLLPALFAWTVRLEEADATPVEVHEDGSLHAAGAPLADGYDLIVIKRPQLGVSWLFNVDDEQLKYCRDMHKRRNWDRRTSLTGVVVFLNDAAPIESIRMPEGHEGTQVELRHLRMRFGLVPPAVRKWWTGDRLWGTDDLTVRETARADGSGVSTLQSAVVGEERIVSAIFEDMVRGRYQITIQGLPAGQTFPVDVAVDDSPHRRLEIARPTRSTTARGYFRSGKVAKKMQVKLRLPVDLDVQIESIELSPHPDYRN